MSDTPIDPKDEVIAGLQTQVDELAKTNEVLKAKLMEVINYDTLIQSLRIHLRRLLELPTDGTVRIRGGLFG